MFTLLFVAFLLTDIAVRLWLASRQIRHVALNRGQVPSEFSTGSGWRATNERPTIPWRGSSSACWSAPMTPSCWCA